MEIKLNTEAIENSLWVISVALSAIGFLVMLFGVIAFFTLDNSANSREAVGPLTILAMAMALAVVPWFLASSVSRAIANVGSGGESTSEGTETTAQ